MDLLSMVETNDNHSTLAESIFASRYSGQIIKILDPYLIGNESVIERDGMIIIQHFGIILKTLKSFGHLISKLEIEYDLLHNINVTEISNFINIYCADSLTDIKINSFHQDFFDVMTKPFENVQYFTIEGRYTDFNSNTLKFVELFPVIRRMHLNSIAFINKSCIIDHEFHHLEHFHVLVQKFNDPRNLMKKDVEQFLRKNTQIRSISLAFVNNAFVKIVSEILPNLESLMVSSFDEEGAPEDIFFQNVTNYTIPYYFVPMPQNVSFAKPYEFRTIAAIRNGYRVFPFVRSQPNLRELTFFSEAFTAVDLMLFTTAHLDIDEIYLPLIAVHDDAFNWFVEESDYMKKITFKPFYRDIEELAEKLHGQFDAKWIITTKANDHEVILERRN